MSDTEMVRPSVPKTSRTGSANETVAEIRPTDSTAVPNEDPYRTRGANVLAPVIDIDRFYDAVPGTNSQLIRALSLLREVLGFLDQAKKSGDPMESDELVQRAQLVLPRLFECRGIGDGFGLIINSLYIAFANLRGKPLNAEQLDVIWRVLRELRSRPALSFEQGLTRVEDLEGAGLEVDPPELARELENSEAKND
jgi:hypothetical protein